MGRGGQTFDASGSALLFGSRGKSIDAKNSGAISRSLKNRTFVEEVEKWKQQETAYIDSVMERLNEAMDTYAQSDDDWQQFLKMYVQTPHYSATNNLWARTQLAYKDSDPDGLILSETQWANLGRRVKAEYCSPHGHAKLDKKFGFDREREWDDRYAAEMMQPLGFNGYFEEELDAAGKPVLDKNGKPKKKFIPLSPKGYKAMTVYHEAATESLDGSPAAELPAAPWITAQGEEASAAQLILDMKDAARLEGLQIVEGKNAEKRDSRGIIIEPARSAVFDKANDSIVVDPSFSAQDQAVGMVFAMSQAVAKDEKRETDEQIQLAHAADESAKYAIASLYNLDTDAQTFPHLSDIRENQGVNVLSSRIHKRVKKLLTLVDPKMEAKARTEGSRAKARKSQKKA